MSFEDYIMKYYQLSSNQYSLTLLTDEEFVKYKPLIPVIEDWWWLKPPVIKEEGQESEDIKFVSIDGNKNDTGWEPHYRIGVRPVLRHDLPELSPGEMFSALGNRWIQLYAGIAISVDTIAHKRVDQSAGYWEKFLKSRENHCCELKTWLEEWGRAEEVE